jgi:intracellular septation protein
MSTDDTKVAAKPKSSWVNLLVDFGPLLIFFLVYRHYAPADNENGLGIVVAVTKATIGFMIATVVALIVSKWRLGRISPMVWLSSVLIIGFGGVTVLLHDPFYIQIKPTAIYLLFAAVLFIGLAKGKPMLRFLLESAFEGLDEEGWLKLSRNWAVFFVVLAVINTVLIYTVSFGTWLQAKVWGFTILSFLFTFSQIPMVMRHGMGAEGEKEVLQNPPVD